MKTLLFFLRLALYLLVVSLPFLHPAIAVRYDRVGLLFYFVLVPWEILAAWLLAPPRLPRRLWLLGVLLPVAVFVLLVSGLEAASLAYLLGALAAALLTALAFGEGGAATAAGLGRALVACEPFLPAWLVFRLLSYSRASEAVARESTGLTQLLLLLVPLAFLLDSLVLYLAAFRRPGERRGARELALCLGVGLPLLLALALLLPPDFVRHRIVGNRVERDLEPEPFPLPDRGPDWDGGNLLAERLRRLGQRGGRGRDGRNQLKGLPADRWGEAGTGEGGQDRQYAVMVVASPVQPVYAASTYFGRLDGEAGFLRSPFEEEPLNQLSYLRFLETWRDPEPPSDRLRVPVEVSYLSTLAERYVAYRPGAIQPTVLRRQYSPFQYSFSAVSLMSTATPADWGRAGDLSAEEEAALAGFLEVPLSGEIREDFSEYLRQALGGAADKAGYAARIDTILRSFSSYQYELGFTDDTSVASLHRFLFESRRGDCTEFSNTAAILLRLAGVPSRVVTGYLASAELQSFAHLLGLLELREAIPELQRFPFEQLLLVTSAQRHSWVQAYLPSLGWIDLESTMHAIPPPPGQDPSDMDVVIPLIQGGEPEPPSFRFPWRAALRLLGALAALTIVGLYASLYLFRAVLALRARRDDPRGLAALHTLLLVRLAGRGLALKHPAQTLREYARQYPRLEPFARLHGQLRFRESLADHPAEQAAAWQALRQAYARALAEQTRAEQARAEAAPARAGRRGGRGRGRLWTALRRVFSLRGLRYL